MTTLDSSSTANAGLHARFAFDPEGFVDPDADLMQQPVISSLAEARAALGAWITAASSISGELTQHHANHLWPSIRNLADALYALDDGLSDRSPVEWHGAVGLVDWIEHILQECSSFERDAPSSIKLVAQAKAAAGLLDRACANA